MTLPSVFVFYVSFCMSTFTFIVIVDMVAYIAYLTWPESKLNHSKIVNSLS